MLIYCYKIRFHRINLSTFFIKSFGLAHTGRVGSVLLTLCISIERYCSVCHSTCNFRAKSLLLPTPIVFAIVYNLPKFFELRSEVYYEDEDSNTTNVENESVLPNNDSSYLEKDTASNYTTPEPTIIIVGTEIRRNPWYIIIYVFWSKFLLVEIVPYLLMVVMNILIWRKIQEFAKIRRDALGIDEGKQSSIMK